MFDINISKLRFWEKEITALKPKRNGKKTRFYSDKDIQIIKQIVFLINEQHLTLEGVNKKLSERQDEISRQQEIYERLMNVRTRLKGILKQINKKESKR
ncbi:MAG: transcriptional regulator [Paludibacter sp.]|nr:MAG: transcriptional regulator [Paludibacter sp.]